MIRHIFTFIALFVVGALAAFATRAARHQPHQEVSAHTSAEHAAMVSNPLTSQKPATSGAAMNDAKGGTTAMKASSATTSHEGHAMATPAAKADGPVNTVCAICGMDVDPALPTAEYKGQTIGFGCRMCPPKFAAEPDKYGPLYLRNEVVAR